MMTFVLVYLSLGTLLSMWNVSCPATHLLIRKHLESKGCTKAWVFSLALFANAVFITLTWPCALGTILGRFLR